MYFTLEPKSDPEDFYDMEEELKSFIHALNSYKFIIVKGLRRYGKTSLILTGLNLSRLDYLFIDCRLLPLTALSFDDFLSLIEFEIGRKHKIKSLLKSIEYVQLGDIIKFRFRKPEVLLRIFEDLENIVFVLDEAQELRKLRFRLDYFLAYALDHLRIKIVVSGSQVGLLYNFLRVNDPEAPLYGRPYKVVDIKPLSREKSIDFLIKGFQREQIKIENDKILEAVENFDGIIGWLAYFGYNYVRGEREIEAIIERAAKIAVSELNHFLETRGLGRLRYVAVLDTIAKLERASWSEIKTRLEARFSKIQDTILANILKNLVSAGILEKRNNEYSLSDPVMKIALKKYSKNLLY
jgi:AAA+ ATPase superfamily predicted ATPase